MPSSQRLCGSLPTRHFLRTLRDEVLDSRSAPPHGDRKPDSQAEECNGAEDAKPGVLRAIEDQEDPYSGEKAEHQWTDPPHAPLSADDLGQLRHPLFSRRPSGSCSVDTALVTFAPGGSPSYFARMWPLNHRANTGMATPKTPVIATSAASMSSRLEELKTQDHDRPRHRYAPGLQRAPTASHHRGREC